MTYKDIVKQLKKDQEIICLDLNTHLNYLKIAIELGFKCKAKIIKSY
jgi:hypothetical protein